MVERATPEQYFGQATAYADKTSFYALLAFLGFLAVVTVAVVVVVTRK